MILWLHYFHIYNLWMFLTHVYNFKFVFFNSTITRLFWHILYYLIFKNFYSLQNAQPFIFQFTYMQLCKRLNCFLKAHNKQLNQYCLIFIFIFTQKKSFRKLFRSWVGLGWPKKHTHTHKSSYGSTHFCFRSKKSGLGRVFLGWVKKIWPILPCLCKIDNHFASFFFFSFSFFPKGSNFFFQFQNFFF